MIPIVKRLWLVLSIAWTLFWLAMWINKGLAETAMVLAVAACPWVTGPVIFYSLRFISTGRLGSRRGL